MLPGTASSHPSTLTYPILPHSYLSHLTPPPPCRTLPHPTTPLRPYPDPIPILSSRHPHPTIPHHHQTSTIPPPLTHPEPHHIPFSLRRNYSHATLPLHSIPQSGSSVTINPTSPTPTPPCPIPHPPPTTQHTTHTHHTNTPSQHHNIPTHQHPNTPTHQHTNTPTHQHLNTSTPNTIPIPLTHSTLSSFRPPPYPHSTLIPTPSKGSISAWPPSVAVGAVLGLAFVSALLPILHTRGHPLML